MIIKLFPEKDTTLYSEYPNKNSGLDEILDLSSKLNSTIVTGNNDQSRGEINRVLIQFNSSSISDIFSSKIGNVNWKAYLKVYLAKASALPQNYTLFTYPISESWDMGSKILFVGVDEKGEKGGLVSRIVENIPNQFVSIQHYGLVKADQEITDGPDVEKWANGFENYRFEENN
jgi:hypothetical protein